MMERNREDIHILVVDDEESIRYTFKIFLEREGYGKITTAATLEEALIVINEERFDLIISDIVLEDASGTDLLKHIMNTGIQCPVVMITGFPNLDTAANSVRYGAFEYISKPVNKETLLRFVRQALRHWQLDQEKKALQLENERFRRYLQVIFSSVSDAIVTVDNEMNITQYNKAASCWIGDLLSGNSRNLSDLSSEVAQAWLNDARLVVEKRKTVREHQVEYLTPGGEKRMISLTAAPLRDENEEFDGAVIVGRDITPALPDSSGTNRTSFHGFVGSSPAMLDMYRLIENVGKVDTAVLVTGESGTGKELAAEALHLESMRRKKRLVKVDCAAVAEDLLESELFGHRKGAFTGADRDRMGRLLQADQGTLFLDEIGDISPRMQLRLLRFLQEQTFTPVGQDKPIQVDVRIIAATNVDLQDKVRKGDFREDLYYRLKVVEIELPPLRQRPSCIPLLVHHYIGYFAETHNLPVYSISDQALNTLCSYRWPGNVRQLRHVIERGCVMCHNTAIQLKHLPVEVFDSENQQISVTVQPETILADKLPVEHMVSGMVSEKEMLLQMLARVGGNKSKAARMLGIDRSTLYRKLKRYNVAG